MSQAKRISMTESPTNKGGAPTNNAAESTMPVLSFPASTEVPSLMPLTDKRSDYASVARTCLQLNQFAGTGSSAATSDDFNNNALFHDASFAKTISAAHAALIECAQTHDDRRCRILACKTLALVARSAYARLRHTPLLFGVREATLHRLEDEVGTDVPVALCSVALEDVDDGVSACALEALGVLTLSNAGMVGTSVEDSLLREVEAIAHARPSPHAPTLMLLEDDDFSTPQLELQCRVYENVLSPRLWRLVQRILHFGSVSQFMKLLPFLTACLRHLCAHTTSFGMDRSEYSKRWVEIDAPAMVDEVISSLLLPAMQQNDAGLAHCASLCTLRLADVLPNASWLPQACPWVVSVLIDQAMACEMLQQKMAILSTLLIALRPLALSERTPTLEFVANEVRFLPSTTRVPSGVVSPGMKSKDGSYRRPARIGFLSEIALSFFVDDDNDDGINDGNVRSTVLKKFLSSAEVNAMLTARSGKKSKKSRIGSNQTVTSVSSGDGLPGSSVPGGKTPTEEYAGSHVGEELVLAFCKVASKAGKQVMMPRGGRCRSSRNLEDWLRCSLAVLSSFSACVNWRSRALDASLNEEDHDVQTLFTLLAAAQGSYIGLLQECIYTVGLLSPASSVSLHVMPLAVPRDLTLLEEMAQNTIALTGFEPVSGVDFAHSDLVTLVDQFLEYKLREGISSRHVRISLLALLTDHWVQSSHHTTAGDSHHTDEPAAIHINELNAREILANLSEEISTLSREINEAQEEGHELRNTAEANEQYLRVCVASVENMALTACDWTRRFGASNANLDEDARYIISLALAALDGKNLRDPTSDNRGEHGKPETLVLCTEAINRVHDVAGANDALQDDAFGIGGEPPALYSSLVAAARLDVKSGIEYTPFLSPSPISLSPDASNHAHLAQYCQQVIGSRFDLAIWSSPLADADDAEKNTTQSPLAAEIMNDGKDIVTPSRIRLRNPLRLAAPPPPSRLPKVVWGPGARMCWSGSTSMVTAGSDPVAVMLAYVARRMPRYDCEPEFHIDVTMKIHNMTAVEISKGVRLGLSLTQKQSPSTAETPEDSNNPDSDIELFSTATIYKQELNAGEHLMWEISLPHIPSAGVVTLNPSVTFRETDGEQSVLKWVGKNGDNGDSEEDAKKDTEKAETELTFDEDNILDVSLSCETVSLSSMASLQPDPLVFFRDAYGDESVFRFLWLQLPYRSMQMKLVPNDHVDAPREKDELADAVANLSTVRVQDRVRTSEDKVEAWAFSTLSGQRLFWVIVSAAEEATLQLRSDAKDLLQSVMGSKSTLVDMVAALTSNHWQYGGSTTQHPDDTAMTVSF